MFFLQIWLLLSGCFFVSSEFVCYFGSVRKMLSGHCCAYLFRIVLRRACLSMWLSTFSLCFVLFAALRCFERIRLFEGLFCLARAKTRLRLYFCGEFSFSFMLRLPTIYILLYLRYFSSTVFLAACLLLWYRNAVRHMRFPQLIHFMVRLFFHFSSVYGQFSFFSAFFDAYSLFWSSVLDC